MNSLPPEILCHIFLLALPQPFHPGNMYAMYPESIEIPLRISHVCRAWRSLSLSFGELWSYLCINCYAYTHETAVKIFDTWLERTNEVPLNYFVACDGWLRDPSHSLAEYFITSMLSQQHRWRRVKFVWKNLRLSSEFQGLKLTNMPMLESLILVTNPSPRASISIARSSKLRRLVLQELDLDLDTGEQLLYSLIESADISFGHSSRPGSELLHIWLDFLKVAPNLKEFVAWSYRNSSPPSSFRPRYHTEPFITLPNLRRLTTGTYNLGVSPEILDFVTLPNLLYLLFAIDTDIAEVNAKGMMVLDFFRRSLPPLTTLVISWTDAGDDIIIQILRLLPALKYMHMTGAIVSRHFFNKLDIAPIGGMTGNTGRYRLPIDDRRTNPDTDFDLNTVVCPCIETLFLERVRFGGDGDPCWGFIAMLRSRARASVKFRNIYFRDERDRTLYTPNTVTRVNLSIAEEDIGQFRRDLRRHLLLQEVVVGDYEAFCGKP